MCMCVIEMGARVREQRPSGSGYGPVIVDIYELLFIYMGDNFSSDTTPKTEVVRPGLKVG